MISLHSIFFFFFFNDTATTEIYTLSLHDALPIYICIVNDKEDGSPLSATVLNWKVVSADGDIITSGKADVMISPRSEEHTSELQSHSDLVCRLLLEKKKNKLSRASARLTVERTPT